MKARDVDDTVRTLSEFRSNKEPLDRLILRSDQCTQRLRNQSPLFNKDVRKILRMELAKDPENKVKWFPTRWIFHRD